MARDSKGKFVPGTSGNPGGRPKMPDEFRELAQKNSIAALRKVIEIMNSPESKTSDILKSCELIIERAYGKPRQEHEVDILANKGYSGLTVVMSEPLNPDVYGSGEDEEGL